MQQILADMKPALTNSGALENQEYRNRFEQFEQTKELMVGSKDNAGLYKAIYSNPKWVWEIQMKSVDDVCI